MSRRLIPVLRHERNMFSYILLHFIEMYTSYLAACKPQITIEKAQERQENKNTDQMCS